MLGTVQEDPIADSNQADAESTAGPPRGPRLPRSSHATYKKYKADTTRLATWLVTTPELLDHDVHTPLKQPSTPAKSKPKGNRPSPVTRNAKRKERKSADKQRPTAARAPVGTALASNSSIDAGEERDKISVGHESLAADAEQTVQHVHFITVLERVVEQLTQLCAPLVEDVKLTATGTDGPTIDVDLLANRRDLDPPAVASPSNKQYELAHDVLDAVFEAEALFADLNVIFYRVLSEWTAFRNGELDLIAASLVTNTALDMVRDREAKLIEQNPDMANPITPMLFLLFSLYFGRGIARPAPGSETLVISLDPVHQEPDDYVFLPTYMLLVALRADMDSSDPMDDAELTGIAERMGVGLGLQTTLHNMKTLKKTVQWQEMGMGHYRRIYANNMSLPGRSLLGMIKALNDLYDPKGGLWAESFFHSNPWLCGQLHFMLLQLEIDMIIHPTASARELLGMAHLSEACRCYCRDHGIDMAPWPDMDKFMRLDDKESSVAVTAMDAPPGPRLPCFLYDSYSRYKNDALKYASHMIYQAVNKFFFRIGPFPALPADPGSAEGEAYIKELAMATQFGKNRNEQQKFLVAASTKIVKYAHQPATATATTAKQRIV
ncbi:hypothetical protein GGF32_007722 [Allomyces javanicus]|nr:hypothetical protein GGF32_007722 [Allomyces javanicus]